MGVAGYHARDVQLFAEPQQLFVDSHLLVPFTGVIGVAVILYFQVISVAKSLFIPLGDFFGGGVLSLPQLVADLAAGAATQTNQAFVMLSQ